MPRLLPALLLLALAAPPAPADWTRFRGPNGSGAVEDPAVPAAWSKAGNVLWSVEVPGVGNSSPVVVKDRIYLQSAARDGSKRMMLCLSAKDGSVVWTQEVPGQKAHTHAKNSLASSTPAVDGERVFGLIWTGDALALHAFSLDGKPLWTASLGGYVSQHGVGASPVAYDGKVYVNYDQDGAAEFACYDAATGAKKWAAPRKPFRACYSCPLIRELPGGKVEVVVASTAGLTGYEPETGAVNWDWVWKFPTKPLRTVGSPILANGVLVAISGDGDGSRAAVAVEPGSSPRRLWQKEKRDNAPYVPGPVVLGDHLYWVSDTGFVVCTELTTGKVAWTEERALPRAVTASPVLVNGNVIAIDEGGRAIVFRATPNGFDKLSQTELGEPVFASPAVADGRLLVRGKTHLFCIGKK